MKTTLTIIFLALVCTCGMKRDPAESQDSATFKIAFGSCAEQYKAQPVLTRVTENDPDLFIYLGDNIYSDTYSIDTLKKNYRMLANRPEFKRLRSGTPMLATWDDHDYGWNDIGRHYPLKHESKKVFLDFFGVADSTVLTHDGIYHSKMIAIGEKQLQVIMLDMRTFRDQLLKYNGNRRGQKGYDYELDYSPYETTDSTLLGTQQWTWLEQQLAKPADIRIIGSSSQFGITHNGYEAWANFPHEQKKFIDLIRKTKAEGVLFISGDVHYSEISKLQADGVYPLYDITSSGITSTWDFATPNDNRIDGPVMENNFGLITITVGSETTINLRIIDATEKSGSNGQFLSAS